MGRGLTKGGVEALHAALKLHVDRGDMPGLVALVARHDDVHVEAIGHRSFGDAEPIGRDAIFRIASITKPIAGVAAMRLIEDGAMALDDPVARWLITVEHVLSFRATRAAPRSRACSSSEWRTHRSPRCCGSEYSSRSVWSIRALRPAGEAAPLHDALRPRQRDRR